MRGLLLVGIGEINKPEHKTENSEWIKTNLDGPQEYTGANQPGFNLHLC